MHFLKPDLDSFWAISETVIKIGTIWLSSESDVRGKIEFDSSASYV